jgi:hypothetical protein
MPSSTVTLEAFQTRVIDDGIAAAKEDYAGEAENRRLMREGSVQGFVECRLKTPAELALLLREADERANVAFCDPEGDRYWYWRCRALEIEWVCNCLSAILYNQGLPTIIPPTYRGMMKAAEIVGVGQP